MILFLYELKQKNVLGLMKERTTIQFMATLFFHLIILFLVRIGVILSHSNNICLVF